jgi:hypothetical protein
MSEQLDTPKTFEQKVEDKIRDSIGDLIDAESLRKIIERGMENIFFKEKEIQDRWGSNIRKEAPYAAQLADRILREEVTKKIDTWLAEHPDAIAKAVEQAMAKGITSVVTEVLDDRMRWMFNNLLSQAQANRPQ